MESFLRRLLSHRHRSGLVLLSAMLACASCARDRPANVLLLTLDTTRADFLGCYGRAGAKTPNLDRLAAEGFLFEHAASSHPVTQASHSTILTGTYPMVHGVRDNGLFHLPDASQTLAEILKSNGFATGAAVGGFPLTVEFGTAQGFDFYDDDLKAIHQDQRGRPQRRRNTWYDERPASHVNDAILPWLRNHMGAPFFVWLHYWDPHEPHIPPAPYSELFAHDLYSGEIAYADNCLGSILEILEEAGELERTVIVVVGDHGEGRREHNELTHAYLAYETTLQVPLIISVPKLAGGRRLSQRVGTVDIVPTVLDLLGIEGPPVIQGRSLAPLMMSRDESLIPAPAYYAESLSPRLSHGSGELRVLYQGTRKYIHGPRPELFDLATDPAEIRDLGPDLETESAAFEEALAAFISENADDTAGAALHEISDETRRRLEALGYVSSSGQAPEEITEVLRSDGAPPQDRVGLINHESRLRKQMASGQFHLALKTARLLVDGAPESPYYRAQLALAYLSLNDLQEAVTVVDETAVFSAANQEIFLDVAWALCDQGDCSRGREIAERLLASEENAAAALTLARIGTRQDDSDLFDHAIEMALRADPENLSTRLERGAQRLKRGDLDGAREDLEWAVDQYPAFARAHLELARLLAAEGKVEQAEKRFDRSISLNPGSCSAHLARLEFFAELGRDPELDGAWQMMKRHCRDAESLERAAELMEE